MVSSGCFSSPTYTAMIDMSSDTETTGTSIDRATRSAVRCRVPVSDVGTFGLGTRCTLARAMRLALTGEKLAAVTAAEWGLVAECVAAEQFPARSEAVLAAFAAGATLALGKTKAAVNAASVDVEAALAREEAGQVALMGTEDYREGVAAFVTKRPAGFSGR